MKLITWNINSVRLRLPLLRKLVAQVKPDIICLQETKVPDDLFPHLEIEALGFPYRHIHGMKSYNGVAILSRLPFTGADIHHRAGRQDCRHISARFKGFTLHNLYIPAGGDIPDREVNDKFEHKLDLVAELTQWFPRHHKKTDPVIACGDFNIAPFEHDVWSHKQLRDVVSHTPVEVDHLRKMQKSLGWTDVARVFIPPQEKAYTWWSYRNQDWKKSNRGRRLDHVWVTVPLAPHLKSYTALSKARDWPQPSDHVPVIVDFSF